jgi:hypothetical protein
MGKIGRQGQGHRDIDGGDGNSGYEVSTKEFPSVLSNPVEERDIVGNVPKGGPVS